MDIGTATINMSLNEYAKLITETVYEIQRLLKELHLYRNNDKLRYKFKLKIMEQQQRLAYLEDAYCEIFKMKGE